MEVPTAVDEAELVVSLETLEEADGALDVVEFDVEPEPDALVLFEPEELPETEADGLELPELVVVELLLDDDAAPLEEAVPELGEFPDVVELLDPLAATPAVPMPAQGFESAAWLIAKTATPTMTMRPMRMRPPTEAASPLRRFSSTFKIRTGRSTGRGGI